MSKIIVIVDYFDVWDVYGYPTGDKELLVSHGINEETLEIVPLPGVSPDELGAVYDNNLNEWVINR